MSTTMVEIVGEPYLSRAIAYRDERARVVKAWVDLMNEFGASGVPHSLNGLNFEGGAKPPAGWTKPSAKNGFSRPKNGHPDEARLKAMPREPDRWAVFAGANIITCLSYKGPKGSGSGIIGSDWFGPPIGWTSKGRYFARLPDARGAAAERLRQHPEDEIDAASREWDPPPGLPRISRAQYDLLIAQDAVERAARDTARAA